MDGLDLVNELNDLCAKLSVSGKQMMKYGNELAEAEKNYKIKPNRNSRVEKNKN